MKHASEYICVNVLQIWTYIKFTPREIYLTCPFTVGAWITDTHTLVWSRESSALWNIIHKNNTDSTLFVLKIFTEFYGHQATLSECIYFHVPEFHQVPFPENKLSTLLQNNNATMINNEEKFQNQYVQLHFVCVLAYIIQLLSTDFTSDKS